MKFEPTDTDHDIIMENSPMEDSVDNLECFGEFCKEDRMCTKYCAYSIRCAVEQSQNPKIDIFDHLLAAIP